MCLTCQNEGAQLDSLISCIEESVNVVSKVVLNQIDINQFTSDKSYADRITNDLEDNIKVFAKNTDGAITAYVRYNPEYTNPTSGVFLSRSSLNEEFQALIPTDFSMYDESDTTHVGWYYIPVKNKVPTWMNPYLNENINVFMISYVVPIYIDGISVGIVGMDIDFSQLTDIVNASSIYDTGYAFLLSKDNDIMYHKDIEMNTNLNSDQDLSEVASILGTSVNEHNTYSYKYKNVQKQLVALTLRNGMKFVLTAPNSEVNKASGSLYRQINVTILIVIVIAVVAGIFLSNSIANPIKKITTMVKQMSELDYQKLGNVNLKNQKNELGTMAMAVTVMHDKINLLVTDLRDVENGVRQNVGLLDNIMKEYSSNAEESSATTEQMAAGMQETSTNTTSIMDNLGRVKEKATNISAL